MTWGERSDERLAAMRDTRLVRALARLKPPVPYVVRRMAAAWYHVAGYASCDHCKLSWNQVDPHSVPTNDFHKAVRTGWFALCEDCWKKLPSIKRAKYMHERFKDRLPAETVKRLVAESLK